MKSTKRRQLILAIVVVTILVTAGVLTVRDYRSSWHRQGVEVGQVLFPDLSVNEVAGITIADPSGHVRLYRRDSRWVVAELHDYPANFEMLADLIRSLPELKVVQSFLVGPDDYSRLQLNDPVSGNAAAGMSLTFADAAGRPLARLVLGKAHRDADPDPYFGRYANGRYLLLPGGGDVVLVTATFDQVTAEPLAWIDKTFPRIQGPTQVTLREGDEELWSLRRGADGALVLRGELPEGQEPEPERLNRVKEVLSWMSFASIGDPQTPAVDWGFGTRQLVVSNVEGFTYTFNIGRRTAQHDVPVTVAVAYREPQLPAGPPGETTAAKSKREADHQQQLQAGRRRFEHENRLYAGWVYRLPRASHEPMLYTRQDFLRAAAEPSDREVPNPQPQDPQGQLPADDDDEELPD